MDWVNFTTFLQMTGNENLLELMRQIEEPKPIPRAPALRLAHLVRIHMATGELLPAVTTWIRTHDFTAVDRVIDTYIDQMIVKAAHELHIDIATCKALWRHLPSQMAREQTKFQDNAKSKESYESLLLHLIEQKTIYRIPRVDRPENPIDSFAYQSQYKFYFSDTAIFRRSANLPSSVVDAETPGLSRFRGTLTENYALQTFLHHIEEGPYYWKVGSRAEVDFIVPFENMIVPVEVKTARNVKSHSLALYRDMYAPALAIRVSLLNLKLDDNLLNVPLYLMDQIPRFIANPIWEGIS